MKMRILHKHPLSFDKAFAFYTEALQGTNALSNEVLKIVSLEQGQFFTLLPDNANCNQLYAFGHSILPEEPKKRGTVGNLPGIHTYSSIASMEAEFADFIYQQMQLHKHQFISDDYNANYQEVKHKDWFNLYGIHYLEEIYYLLSAKNANPQLIEQCLSNSKTFWHSLSILSKTSALDYPQKTVQLPDIQMLAKAARFVFVGAYDGEGYVVWTPE